MRVVKNEFLVAKLKNQILLPRLFYVTFHDLPRAAYPAFEYDLCIYSFLFLHTTLLGCITVSNDVVN